MTLRERPLLPLRHVLRTELRLLVRDGTAFVSVTLLVSLLGYALWNAHARLAADVRAYEAVLVQEREKEAEAASQAAASTKLLQGQTIDSVQRYVRHGPTHPQWVGASWSFRVAALRPPALSVLAVGQFDVTPTVYRIRTNRLIEPYRQGEQTGHPFALATGTLDATTVVLMFLPLLVIALGADLVAGDRERGTWLLLRAEPVSLASLIVARAAPRIVLTAVPVVGAVVGAWLLTAPESDSGLILRLLLWLLGSLAYLGFWWAAVLYGTACRKTTAGTIAVLMACWVGSALVAPTAVRLWLDWQAPIPHRAIQILAERVATAEADALQADAALATYLRGEPELARRYGSIVGQATQVAFASGPYYLVGEARDYASERMVRPVLDQIESARRTQARLARWASVVSPTMLAHAMLLDAAGTGDAAVRAYRQAVEQFHQTWRAFFLPRLFEIAPLGAAEYKELPRFEYQAPDVRSVLFTLLLQIAMLGGCATVLGIAAGRRLGRRDLP